jgi:putative addiction module antidote
MKAEIRNSNGGLVLTLPDELIARLDCQAGDIVDVEPQESGLKVVRVETAFDRTMKIAEQVMDEYHDGLAELAKS